MATPYDSHLAGDNTDTDERMFYDESDLDCHESMDISSEEEDQSGSHKSTQNFQLQRKMLQKPAATATITTATTTATTTVASTSSLQQNQTVHPKYFHNERNSSYLSMNDLDCDKYSLNSCTMTSNC